MSTPSENMPLTDSRDDFFDASSSPITNTVCKWDDSYAYTDVPGSQLTGYPPGLREGLFDYLSAAEQANEVDLYNQYTQTNASITYGFAGQICCGGGWGSTFYPERQTGIIQSAEQNR